MFTRLFSTIVGVGIGFAMTAVPASAALAPNRAIRPTRAMVIERVFIAQDAEGCGAEKERAPEHDLGADPARAEHAKDVTAGKNQHAVVLRPQSRDDAVGLRPIDLRDGKPPVRLLGKAPESSGTALTRAAVS